MRKRYRGAVFLLVVMGASVRAEMSEPTIRNIIIDQQNVFNTEISAEDKWLFRVANKIHFATKEAIIKRELLLKEGDICDEKLRAESERNLRAYKFIKAVSVKCVPIENNRVDVVVKAVDSWTTYPRIDFGRRGSENFFLVGLEEINFGGYGKTLGIFYSQAGNETQKEIRYADPQLFGSRTRLTTLFSQRSNGRQIGIEIAKPFYSYSTPSSISFSFVHQRKLGQLFENNKSYSDFHHGQDFVRIEKGKMLDYKNDAVKRFVVGFEYQKDVFDVMNNGLRDRTTTGIDFGFSIENMGFIKVQNVNSAYRDEDINLGNRLDLIVGYSPRALGSDRNRTYFDFSDHKGLYLGSRSFALVGIGTQGKLASGKLENTLWYANLNFVHRFQSQWPQVAVIHTEGLLGQNLYKDSRIRLGGMTGLRGFSSDELVGDKSFLFNGEYRLLCPTEFFSLVYLGVVTFFDAGFVASRYSSSAVRTDIGFGLRIIPSRSSSGRPWRIDVARQLHSGSQKKYWVFSIAGGHAFNFFNNAADDTWGKPSKALEEDDAGARHNKRY